MTYTTCIVPERKGYSVEVRDASGSLVAMTWTSGPRRYAEHEGRELVAMMQERDRTREGMEAQP